MALASITERPFDTSTDRDWQRGRRLLIETRHFTGPEFNWEIRHWDGNRYHRTGPDWQPEHYQNFHVWEAEFAQPAPGASAANGAPTSAAPAAPAAPAPIYLAGVAHIEGGEELCLQVHPRYRSQVEEDMFAWAEKHFRGMTPTSQSGPRGLYVTVWEYDLPRLRILKERGYVMTGWVWRHRILRFAGQPLPFPKIAMGYRMRPLRPGNVDDARRMAELLNAAFNRPGFHQPEEVYNFMQRSPSFCSDLHLVAEASDGSFASHVALTLDEPNKVGIFEPVCTHPEHLRNGLAQSLMFELLHRGKAMGAYSVTVSTGGDDAANALYDSIGFTEMYQAHVWRKVF